MSSVKWSNLSAVLYKPKLNLKTYFRNTLFLANFFLAKKGYYRNELFGLNNLEHFYAIIDTFI